MAMAAALTGHLIRDGRKSHQQIVATVLLEQSQYKPYGIIRGKLVMRLDSEFKHFGIRVQFEAVCNLQFETKFDSRVTFHKKQLSLIAKSLESDSEGYQVSPVMLELVETRPTLQENQNQTWSVILAEQPAPNLPPARPYIMQPGIHNFGFELNIPGETMPAPFRSPYGSLIYKVVAYFKNESAAFVHIADKSIRFSGYHNLLLNEEAGKPIHLERTLKKSVFSNKKFVTAMLDVERSGFLPDEDIHFTLNVNNPKAMTMSSIAVSLIQKVNYNVSGATKSTTNILDTKEYQVKEPKTEIDWRGKLRVKKRQIPTFTLHPMYNVTHILTYKVQVPDYGSLKGESPIYIGTTRESEDELMKSASLPDEPDPKVPKSLKIRRQASSASTTSTMSTASELECSARTPNYSPTEDLRAASLDDEVLESAKKLDEMSLSPTEEISTSSV